MNQNNGFEKVLESKRFQVWINKNVKNSKGFMGYRIDLETNQKTMCIVAKDAKTGYRVVDIIVKPMNLDIQKIR